ncbi:Flp pilus assembly protein CpaB [Myxococcota bacterium]|nr:Flp pilus assembly protein CpaB [Myxococcota bacterium]MBU1497077.1 Flp pilus assembly protein CpaB [Myxococcota bacterium]
MKGIMPIVIAVVLALAAAFIVTRIVSKEKAKLQARWKTVKVLVASQDIKARTPLSVEVVEEGTIPEQYYNENMLTANNLEAHRRRLIIHHISKGQPIYFHNLEGQEGDKSLGSRLRLGGRAITIPVNQVSAVGYWLQPNDHVDVVGTFQNAQGENAEMVALTILENIVVLKTGNRGKEVAGEGREAVFSTVTMLVLPEEAEMLVLAQKVGSISLTLRNPEDRGLMQERAWTTLKTLLTRERAKKLRMKRIQTLDTINIIRGISKTLPPGVGGN